DLSNGPALREAMRGFVITSFSNIGSFRQTTENPKGRFNDHFPQLAVEKQVRVCSVLKSYHMALASWCQNFVKDRILDDPGVLGATALARIHHERFFLQSDPCQSAWHDPHAVRAGEHEGPQIDMTGSDTSVAKRRRRRERERRLGDEIVRIVGKFRRENLAFGN